MRLVGKLAADVTAAREYCQQLRDRIATVRPSSLAGAVLARADNDDPKTIGVLADLLAQQGGFDPGRIRFFLMANLDTPWSRRSIDGLMCSFPRLRVRGISLPTWRAR